MTLHKIVRTVIPIVRVRKLRQVGYTVAELGFEPVRPLSRVELFLVAMQPLGLTDTPLKVQRGGRNELLSGLCHETEACWDQDPHCPRAWWQPTCHCSDTTVEKTTSSGSRSETILCTMYHKKTSKPGMGTAGF